MQYTLSNDNFEVIVDSKGCEIVSVIRKSDNKQYIWSGQPDIWKRHTPVLFPLVGRYKNDRYFNIRGKRISYDTAWFCKRYGV